MDNRRLILFFALALVSVMLWQAWQRDYGQPAQQTAGDQIVTDETGAVVPTIASDSGIPSAPVQQTEAGSAAPVTSQAPTGQIIKVETDLLRLTIDTRGGTVRELFLKDYSVSSKDQEDKFQLFKPDTPDLFVAQTGLIGKDPASAPTHEALFQAPQTQYQMTPDQESLEVNLVWQGAGGVKVTKQFVFHRGSYKIDVNQLVENGSAQPWSGRAYRQLLRTPPPSGEKQSFVYTYTGGAIYSPEDKYQKIKFEKMSEEALKREVTGGWVGMLQHYFFAAWVPPAQEQDHFYSAALSGDRYQIGCYSPQVQVASGASHTFSGSLVVGPKLQNQLREIAPGLDLVVDYGWLTVLAQPIFWLLEKLHALFGNWGWAIIVLTLLIKLAFFKLSETSYKSMANMRRMTPRMQALKERFGDDKEKLNQAMMDLYRKEKINPLGGCLPIVIQIPVFIALYWVLAEAVELRQAPFIFWITDLSVKDPYFVLPVIMGVSMFIQQKLNPTPPDPMQAKIMMALPFVFGVFFAFFPSGLVLYWVVNNILSIAQQWYITRSMEKAASH